MVQLFVSFLVVIHLLFRGEYNVKTYATGREKLHRQCCYTKNGVERCIVLRCRQYCHDLRCNRWYVCNRRYYTYTVEMVKVDNDVYVDYHLGHYPQLCTRALNKTDYPLNCAINAHLDTILRQTVF